ncbi:iron chelate uptake ABC transporter family permease subunit [Streptococcus halichoeri]|uniref:iron chelate uptake ABC transporter family permease subunit n=1 Tax=Streptococcus halichoeri TaxID=254785 RepID=UPI0013589910|nr:iron chelate uptake ABC transporter family permease subunit [Streptococcus halichoeri]
MKLQLEKQKILGLGIILLTLTLVFFLYGLPLGANRFLLLYYLKTRYLKFVALLLIGICIGTSSLIFQTITANRLLTPAIVGLDSLFIFIQTLQTAILGSQKLLTTGPLSLFVCSLVAMLFFAYVLFGSFFKEQHLSLYFVLLVGLIFNTLFTSLAKFIQVIMDPNEFLVLQSHLFTSFNALNASIMGLAWVLVGISFLLNYRLFAQLDVLLLGSEQAKSLGVAYDRLVRQAFLWVALLVAIATALVGPITFLGLVVVHLTYQMFPNYRHTIRVPMAILICIIALLIGQIGVQYVLKLAVPLPVLLNFLGGSYFIICLIKENKRL